MVEYGMYELIFEILNVYQSQSLNELRYKFVTKRDELYV